jgi:putative membrane protein
MFYLWIKALHVVFVVAWFAGLFYLPRLFVYHVDSTEGSINARFCLMERKLYRFTTMNALLAVGLATSLLVMDPHWLQQTWLRWKLGMVVAVVIYHATCGRLVAGFATGRNRHSALWYRWFNEVPAVLLLVIVLLAILKPV